MSADILKKDGIGKGKIYLLGAVLGTVGTIVAMLAFSAILLFTGIDRSYATPFATVSIAVGCFIAGRYTAKKIGDKGYAVGLIIAIVVFGVITLLSLLFGGKGFSINTLFHFVIIMLASLTGGIIGVNADKHKKYI